MMEPADNLIVVLIGTYRRFDELKRCLDCIQSQTIPVGAVLVLDNAADGEIQKLVAEYDQRYQYMAMKGNDGCGAALKVGEQYGLEKFGSRLTYFWILDDDAAPAPDTLEKLLTAGAATNAALVAPVCIGPDGSLFGLPDAVKPPRRGIRKAFKTSEDVHRYYGDALVPIVWCTGVCYLVKATAVASAGPHRDDFWMQGDDIEFAMRICQKHGGVLVPWVTVPHLYPASSGGSGAARIAHTKACSLLQNISYLGVHEIHTWRTFYYIFANLWRFFKGLGVNMRAVRYGIRAMFNGVILAEPAGCDSGAKLRQRIARDFSGTN